MELCKRRSTFFFTRGKVTGYFFVIILFCIRLAANGLPVRFAGGWACGVTVKGQGPVGRSPVS